VNECFQNWASQNSNIHALLAYICWYIWIDRNKSIFEEKSPSLQRIVYLAQGAMGISKKFHKDRIPRSTATILLVDKSLSWFDGVAQ
jgi:hypothetical protein